MNRFHCLEVIVLLIFIGDSMGVIGTAKKSFVSELLIVCDKAFGDHFQQDRQKIIDYWAARIWDTNMRFKTLNKIELSFRVSQLITFKERDGQPFITNATDDNGSFNISESLDKFADWLYIKRETLTKFDMAILVTGADPGANSSNRLSFPYGPCHLNAEEGRHYSASVIQYTSPWGDPCSLLAKSLTVQFEVPWDSETEAHMGCKGHGYLMDQEICGSNRYFFSKCTNDAIEKYFKYFPKSCLNSLQAPNDDVISTYSKALHPPSIQEQCRLLTNNPFGAAAGAGNSACVVSKCYIPLDGKWSFSKDLYPIDNSPCGNNNTYCFRGRCLPQGYRLRNVKFGKCLHASNRFASDDPLKLLDCSKLSTPLDQFMISENQLSGLVLKTSYSTPDASVNDDKCLSVDEKEEHLQFSSCSVEHQAWLGWMLIKVDAAKSEFLLFHPATKSCARFRNGKIEMKQSCDSKDVWMRWKFHGKVSVPETWLKPREAMEGINEVTTRNYSGINTTKRPTTTTTGDTRYTTTSLPPRTGTGTNRYTTQRATYGFRHSTEDPSRSWNNFDTYRRVSTSVPMTTTVSQTDNFLLEKWEMSFALIIFGIMLGILAITGFPRLWKKAISIAGARSENEGPVVYARDSISLNVNIR